MTQEFYSNGKLLISGEYAVLDGALALAIPTKYGQYLRVTPNTSSDISWKSLDEKGKIWFEGNYQKETLEERSSSDNQTSAVLQNLLSKTKELNPNFLSDQNGYTIETELSFQKDWGLGSSSTLINNIANWAHVDAQQLSSETLGGSGYDIACAQHATPILYQIENGVPLVKEIALDLPFSDQMYFVYLNQKKNSRDAIASYRERVINKDLLITKISELTRRMSISKDITEFDQLITEHEIVLSDALGIPSVKSELFPDFSGAIKSLGGWGGDFILATGDENIPRYFKNKGYRTTLSFNEMIL